MNYKYSYSEITQKFLKFEDERELLTLDLQSVKPWQIARIIIFLEIVNYYIPGNISPNKESIYRKVKRILYRIFINSIFYNPFIDRSTSEILIFESGRKYKKDNKYIDIYTHYLYNDLKNQKKRITIYEPFYNENDNLIKSDKKTKHLDFLRFKAKFFQKLIKCSFNSEELQKIKVIEKDLKNEFNIELNIQEIFAREIKKFKAELALFEKLFKIKNPKEIYVINSCDKPAMIYAAKMNKIIVNELQHGLNSDKDVILNFPYTVEDSLDYFPDKFFIWNNIDMFFAKLPISKQNIKYLPNYHIEHVKNITNEIKKEKGTILIISQPYGAEGIQQFIVKNIKDLNSYKVIYKIHPVENLDKIQDFKKSCNSYSNISFVNNEESIYVLLKKAEYVVGIYSSALFEAAAFECKIILLNLPGVEMSMDLLEIKDNQLIKFDEKLLNVLSK